MTKTIKIISDDHRSHAAVEAALKAANGGATAHTYTRAADIAALARAGEAKLEALGVPKAMRAGAAMSAVSGSRLPNAYKYTAKATIVRIIRRGAGWYLESAGTTDLHPGSTPAERLHLTPDQDAKAIAVLRTQYSLMTPAT